VEAVPDQTFIDLPRTNARKTTKRFGGQVLYVPILEAPGQTGVGRFGWKDQHASLLSFSAMLISTKWASPIASSRRSHQSLQHRQGANDTPGPDGLADIDRFARFMRATETPARDSQLAQTPKARLGAQLFEKVGCDICHVQTLTTAPTGTKINGDLHHHRRSGKAFSSLRRLSAPQCRHRDALSLLC